MQERSPKKLESKKAPLDRNKLMEIWIIHFFLKIYKTLTIFYEQ